MKTILAWAAAVSVFLAMVASASAHVTAAASSAASHARRSATIYWGAYIEGPSTYGGGFRNVPWDTQTWQTFERNAGKKVSLLHWGLPAPWEQSFNAQLEQHKKIRRDGALEVVDMTSGDVPLRDIAAGRYDAAISDWARQARAYGHPMFLRWDWEMNGTWFAWATAPGKSTTPAEYVAAWRHMHDLFAAAGAKNISWVWCPNVAFNGSTPYEQLYPGDAYVDWTCLDGYNKGGQYSTTFVNLFSQSYRALLRLAPKKPIMIGETASVEDSGKKAQWITAALNALPTKFPRIKAMLWFNWQISEDGTTWQWQIESSSAAQQAFARGIASPYFAPAGKVKLPKRQTAISPP